MSDAFHCTRPARWTDSSAVPWCVIFKAGTSDKTFDAWRVAQNALEPRDYVNRTLPEERFQWAFLDRLVKEAVWRDDDTFELLNTLFENPWGRRARAAAVIALEFQGQLAGRLEPLKIRATRMIERLAER